MIYFRPKLRQRRKEFPQESLWESSVALLARPGSLLSRPQVHGRLNQRLDTTSTVSRTSRISHSQDNKIMEQETTERLEINESVQCTVGQQQPSQLQQSLSIDPELPAGECLGGISCAVNTGQIDSPATEITEEEDEDVQEEDALEIGMVPGEDLRGEVSVRRFQQRQQVRRSTAQRTAVIKVGARTNFTGALEVFHEEKSAQVLISHGCYDVSSNF